MTFLITVRGHTIAAQENFEVAKRVAEEHLQGDGSAVRIKCVLASGGALSPTWRYDDEVGKWIEGLAARHES